MILAAAAAPLAFSIVCRAVVAVVVVALDFVVVAVVADLSLRAVVVVVVVVIDFVVAVVGTTCFLSRGIVVVFLVVVVSPLVSGGRTRVESLDDRLRIEPVPGPLTWARGLPRPETVISYWRTQ